MTALTNGARTNGAPKLKRSMGLWMATALVVGNMVGSGVFLLPATLAGAAGPVSLLGWVFTGTGAVLLALVFANLGRTFPRTGGPYAYAKRAFGDFVTKGFVLLLCGIPVYVGMRWWERRKLETVALPELDRERIHAG